MVPLIERQVQGRQYWFLDMSSVGSVLEILLVSLFQFGIAEQQPIPN